MSGTPVPVPELTLGGSSFSSQDCPYPLFSKSMFAKGHNSALINVLQPKYFLIVPFILLKLLIFQVHICEIRNYIPKISEY
jgi:hypothetical protein